MQPHCKCPEYTKGDRCEYRETCKYIKCKNNGKCSNKGKCDCPNGWGGFYCEIGMTWQKNSFKTATYFKFEKKNHSFTATAKSSTPSFRGNSYLIIPSPRIPIKDKRNNGPVIYNLKSLKNQLSISLNFSTIFLDGLLFWNSKNPQTFIGVGIENGHIKLASNHLDTETSAIDVPTGGFVADGAWHTIHLDVNANVIKIMLDGRPTFSVNRRMVDTKSIDDNVVADDLFYIGKYF